MSDESFLNIEVQDLSDQEASLIKGGQVTSITELRDVLPIEVRSPETRRILIDEIVMLARR
jgi:hypothetical protein